MTPGVPVRAEYTTPTGTTGTTYHLVAFSLVGKQNVTV